MNSIIQKKNTLACLIPESGVIDVVIDSDAFNEVDDQFAIAWALKSTERFNVEAIYAAPFSHNVFSTLPVSPGLKPILEGMAATSCSPESGMEQSYQEILKLGDFLSMDLRSKTFRGSPNFISESSLPIDSPAARDLVHRAMNHNGTLYILAIGAITNIASAILMEPQIIDKIAIVWLAGQPLDFGHGIEFNMMEDIKASQIILDSKVPLVLIPCMTVASHLSVSKEELDTHLNGKSDIGTYLTEIVEKNFGSLETYNFMHLIYRKTYLKNCDDYNDSHLSQYNNQDISWSRIIWDISVVAYLMNPNWVLTKEILSPILNNDLSYSTNYDNRHNIRIATYIFRDPVFGSLFNHLTRLN